MNNNPDEGVLIAESSAQRLFAAAQRTEQLAADLPTPILGDRFIPKTVRARLPFYPYLTTSGTKVASSGGKIEIWPGLTNGGPAVFATLADKAEAAPSNGDIVHVRFNPASGCTIEIGTPNSTYLNWNLASCAVADGKVTLTRIWPGGNITIPAMFKGQVEYSSGSYLLYDDSNVHLATVTWPNTNTIRDIIYVDDTITSTPKYPQLVAKTAGAKCQCLINTVAGSFKLAAAAHRFTTVKKMVHDSGDNDIEIYTIDVSDFETWSL